MTTARPRYNRCDSCGRNAHKVAVRTPRGVFGYCPSCFARRSTFPADSVVIYDRRSDRSKVSPAQRDAVARVRKHVGPVVKITATIDGGIDVDSTDTAGNPRRHHVDAEGVAAPVHA